MNEHEEVSMRCSVRYEGVWAPSIHWYDAAEQLVTVGVYNETNNSIITSNLTLKANASHHDHIYKCRILFDNSTGLMVQQLHVSTKVNYPTNVNVPSYQHTCIVPDLRISCK